VVRLSIETITFVYNEEFLMPFYLNHYNFCDRLNIVYDEDSTDRTLEILKRNQKVNIIPYRFPDGMDDALRAEKTTEIYGSLRDTWVLVVDCDEFAFVDKMPERSVNRVRFYSVYRHIKEKDLDPNIPIQKQRSHGGLHQANFCAIWNRQIKMESRKQSFCFYY
jgi:hypothetical protein